MPDGWQAAQQMPIPGHPRNEGPQTRGSTFQGSEIFVAATYDPATQSGPYGCKGGGPILDPMPDQGVFVDLLEEHDQAPAQPSNLPREPKRFTYRKASRVLHECSGESFVFGPFKSSGHAFVARIFMHSGSGERATRLNATSHSRRKAALDILQSLEISPQR